MGIPLEETYFSGICARSAWDVEVYDNKLFVGSGDYDQNLGPVSMCFYDFSTGSWELEDILNDEQIGRFYIFDNVLYAPGLDPRVSWETGNYYSYKSGGDGWETHTVLPNGVHNFDLIKFNGKLFAGLGVEEGSSPVVMSEDGENWVSTPLYKDGALRETYNATFIRVYDFFVLNDTLYAYFSLSGTDVKSAWEIYRFDGEKFVYHSDLPTSGLSWNKHTYVHFYDKVEFKGCQYFSTGNLYKTTDMVTAELMDMGENTEVTGLRIIGKELYALCSTPVESEDGRTTFHISVRKSRDGKTFNEVFYFDYDVRAMSFTYSNGTFYLGMGFGTTKTGELYDKNGMVLSVEYATGER